MLWRVARDGADCTDGAVGANSADGADGADTADPTNSGDATDGIDSIKMRLSLINLCPLKLSFSPSPQRVVSHHCLLCGPLAYLAQPGMPKVERTVMKVLPVRAC